MRSISIAFALALLLAIVVEAMLQWGIMNIENLYLRYGILALIIIIAIALLIWGFMPRKDLAKENIVMITPKGRISLRSSKFKRIITWLRTH